MENTFPPAFIAKVNETPGFHADLIKIGGVEERLGDAATGYRVIVDRFSHEVPYYRFFLKAAALAGTYVINDPFWWSADDKFFGYSLAAKIGVAVPRTVMLPQKAYIPGIDPTRGRSATSSTRSIGRPSRATSASPPSSSPPTAAAGRTSTASTTLEELLRVLRHDERARDDAPAVHRLRRVRALHLHRPRLHPAHPVRPEATAATSSTTGRSCRRRSSRRSSTARTRSTTRSATT